MNDCLIPVPRETDDNRWINQHNRHVQECKDAEPELLLIGASIIQKMVDNDKFWSEVSCFHPLNLGIGGDRTQHLLWRIQNGSLHEINPKAVVLNIGANCTENTAQEISEGVVRVIDELQKIYPKAYIIVWGLLPRGEFPNSECNRNSKVNEILTQSFSGNRSVEIICSNDVLRQSDGRISREDMYDDFIHLTEQGYVKAFSPVLDKLKEIFRTSL